MIAVSDAWRDASTPMYLAGLSLGLARQAGQGGADVWGHGVRDVLAAAAQLPGPRANPGITVTAATEAPGTTQHLFAARSHHRLRLAGAPPCAGREPPSLVAETPDLRLLQAAEGYLLHLGHAPIVVAADGTSVLAAYSSRYARLVNFIDLDIGAALRTAREIPGPVFVLSDDSWPPRYGHWLLDVVPRLAARAALTQPDTLHALHVAVPPLQAGWQRELLGLCGFDGDRLIELAPMQALRAGTLLATSDLSMPFHPTLSGVPWALRFLRQALGKPVASTPRIPLGRRLYLASAHGPGPRVVNEAEILAALQPFGFEPIDPSPLTVSGQIAVFSGAACIVGASCEAMANIVFAPPGSALLELASPSTGPSGLQRPAAVLGQPYDRLFGSDEPVDRPQCPDMRVDPEQVVARLRRLHALAD